MRSLLRVSAVLAFWALVGCAPSMEVQRMEPIRLPHTYSVMLLTSKPPTDLQRKLLAKMEETLNFEQMLNVVYLPQVAYLDGSQKTLNLIAQSGADTVILFRKLQLQNTTGGCRLVANMSFLKPVVSREDSRNPGGPGLGGIKVGLISKGERSITLELNQKVSVDEAINLMGTKLALEMSDQITPAEEAKFAPYMAPPGGPADMGEEGDF